MKIKELLESNIPRDKTRKDHNGNFLGYDPERKVWVVVPRYEGIGMIRRGELANGVLKIPTNYPEFKPSAAPKADFDVQTPHREKGAGGHAMDLIKNKMKFSSAMNRAGRDAVDQIANFPKDLKYWMAKEKEAHKSKGPGTNR